MVAWEVTRNCNLNCVHCRAAADRGPHGNELTREECFGLIDSIVSFSKPVIILTGGEPLLRADIFDIASYGQSQGLRMVMAVNGTLLTPEIVKRLINVGIRRISISIDGASAESHDAFRRVPGAFFQALKGIEYAKKDGLEFQINTTITKRNLDELSRIYALAVDLGAVAHHIFVLVPTGRGKELAKEENVTPDEYDRVLEWFCEQEKTSPLELKATCAPQYYRMRLEILDKEQRAGSASASGFAVKTRGCLGGVGFCFISNTGTVAPCGYLDLDCGNIREQPLSDIWAHSTIFEALRNYNGYEGKCGSCQYVRVCGGCRARAFYETNRYLAVDPLCTYEPSKTR
jgi:heme b synthase